MLQSICQQIWKPQQRPRNWKRSVFIPIPKKGNTKECSIYCTIELITHTSKVMLKILHVRFLQYENQELPYVQAGFRNGIGTRDQISSFHWIIEKAREFQKKSTLVFLTMPKPLTMWITTNSGKFFKKWEYQTTWPASWEICMQVKKQQNQTWNNGLAPNWERSVSRLVYCHPAYLICRVHHAKCWTGWNTSWNKDCQDKY